ncbi:hypothetical protein [Chryseobacterium sp. OSA05B]|uniref:hypothetical protein n=1 Tax=Chryseobacterium sp. OSA05B TaxID=2862650 RepID=UPI001CBEF86D|nr:hypothetical protein [Chryseobacterium sp. OSA05B]
MSNVLQEHWSLLELVGIDSMVFSDGRIKIIDIFSKENKEIVNTFGKEYYLSMVRETDLNEIVEKYDDDIWSNCQINDQIIIDNKFVFVCGEGEMGNEGFIVKLDMDGTMIWSLYSTTSNPFLKFICYNGQLQVVSSAGFAVVVDVSTDNISIENNLS